MKWGVIDRRAEALVIAHYFAAMGVKALSPDDAVNTLSGGNQQKVCLGRVFATQPRLLMVDERRAALMWVSNRTCCALLTN